MSENTKGPWAKWADENHAAIEAAEAASALPAPEPQGQSARSSPASGYVPWCWTDRRDAEFWAPAGRSREQAIAEGRRRTEKGTAFWIAPTQRATKRERENYESRWLVDSAKSERISQNVRNLPRDT